MLTLFTKFNNLSIKTTPDFLKRGELVLFWQIHSPLESITGVEAGGFCFSLLLKPKEDVFILNNPDNVLESLCIFLVRSLCVSMSVTL